MNNAGRLTGIIVCTLFLAVSCRQIYTESMGSSLSRSKPGISSSASLNELMDITRTRNASDPDVARELLDALGEKDPEAINGLSMKDKADILNLAGAASIDLGTVADLSRKLKDNPDDRNQLIQDAISKSSKDVDTKVLELLLSDDQVLTEAPSDTIVVAATAIIAGVSSEAGVETVTDILANPSTLESSSLTREQKDRLAIVIHATEVLETRPDADAITIGDFDLLDLLRGNQ